MPKKHKYIIYYRQYSRLLPSGELSFEKILHMQSQTLFTLSLSGHICIIAVSTEEKEGDKQGRVRARRGDRVHCKVR